MPSIPSRSLLRTLPRSRPSPICLQCRRRYASETPPAPPLLLKLRQDLKTAMKEKDTNRLSVLRTLLADVTNQAKTSTPIKTDMQLLALLRKRAAASRAASGEFKAAGREDLVEREEGQARIMEDYAGSVETLTEVDVREAVGRVVEEVRAVAEGKVNMGDVLKRLLGPGGSLDGKPVEKSQVAKVVKEVLG
ncbi:GatB/YqeY domain-containing protein [Teratosphaeria destructans]|uniref:Altered inheritance of mitochondria protein 41 n=1 Tax=Teratosphaeria destructans TaxID=418781 RepID=A0A9W7W051_9PEZI|nr:GatB/YqeY domain-containing protein [Teratosphaeria destructans]